MPSIMVACSCGSGVSTVTSTDNDDLRYVYPMSVVERMTGLTRRRIRYYEHCGLITPRRTPGRHRLYSDENVDMLRRIKDLVDSGIRSMESVRRMIRAGLDRPARRQSPPAYGDVAARWAAHRDSSDAALRVMRPVEPNLRAARKPELGDSVAFFTRTAVIPKPTDDTRKRQ